MKRPWVHMSSPSQSPQNIRNKSKNKKMGPLFLFISLFLADSLERKSRLRNPGYISLFPSLTFSSLTLDHQVLVYYRTNKGHPSAPVLNTLFHASNLDRWSISHMVICSFQCYSLKSSHPHVLPQSPKVCSLYLCLFCCLAYRVIVAIFLNFIYVC